MTCIAVLICSVSEMRGKSRVG